LHVEGCGFEEDVGAGCGEPVADVGGRRPQGLKPSLFMGLIGTAEAVPFPVGVQGESGGGIESRAVGDPSQAARSDSGDAKGDAVARAEFFCAVFKEADQGPVDVAEAEEAEVVGADGNLLDGILLQSARARCPFDKLRAGSRDSRRDAGVT